MKIAYFTLVFVFTHQVFSQNNNNIAIVFDGTNNLLGVNYSRNIHKYFGVTASFRTNTFSATSFDDNFNNGYPQGKYNKSVYESIATVEGDFIDPNGNIFGTDFNENVYMGGLGIFIEKKEFITQKLNVKLTCFFAIIRQSGYEHQSAYVIHNATDPDGNEGFQFNYFQYQYKNFWSSSYMFFEFQTDYSVYKNFYLGLNFSYTPVPIQSQFAGYFGNFTLGTRF